MRLAIPASVGRSGSEPPLPGYVRTDDSILRDRVLALKEQALIYQARNVRQ
jgi:hypothetical protein